MDFYVKKRIVARDLCFLSKHPRRREGKLENIHAVSLLFSSIFTKTAGNGTFNNKTINYRYPFKGQCQEIFDLRFFHQTLHARPLIQRAKAFLNSA
jgi:hypothetical protein